MKFKLLTQNSESKVLSLDIEIVFFSCSIFLGGPSRGPPLPGVWGLALNKQKKD